MAKNAITFRVLTDKLEFDRGNPRLVELEDLHAASDENIMSALVEQADIGELVESIVANRYMDIEPLIVTKSGAKIAGNYRVLEGNRRLSAIRFLKHPDLAKQCRISVPREIPEDVLASLEEVTVYEVENEEESKAFIAFKHINGAHRWDAYAKARYITAWYINEYESGITIDEIASKVGDKNQYVRSIISGMLILMQAEDNETFKISDRKKQGKFGFSHLYTALGRIEYRNFLGLEKDWNQRPDPNPVRHENTPKLQEILYYLYGSKKDNVESVIRSQNPDLKRLGRVIAHPVALEVLRTTWDLDQSEEEVLPSEEVFQDALITAYSKVLDAQKKVSKYSPTQTPGLVKIAEETAGASANILLVMKSKTS